MRIKHSATERPGGETVPQGAGLPVPLHCLVTSKVLGTSVLWAGKKSGSSSWRSVPPQRATVLAAGSTAHCDNSMQECGERI